MVQLSKITKNTYCNNINSRHLTKTSNLLTVTNAAFPKPSTKISL